MRKTRRIGVPVYAPLVKTASPAYFEVQVGQPDVRPAARHYGLRFRPTVRKARRAVAERVMLNMRTDGECVRLAEKG